MNKAKEVKNLQAISASELNLICIPYTVLKLLVINYSQLACAIRIFMPTYCAQKFQKLE
jgi:hypothetical protein